MEPLEPLMPLLLWWKRGVSCRGQPCICGQMPLASGPRVSEQPSACAGAEKSARGRPECRARSPQWSRLLATIEAWSPSSIIQGLQLSPGPTVALLWTALSGKDGLPHVRAWRAGAWDDANRKSVDNSHIYILSLDYVIILKNNVVVECWLTASHCCWAGKLD